MRAKGENKTNRSVGAGGVGKDEGKTYEPNVLGHFGGVTRGCIPSSSAQGLGDFTASAALGRLRSASRGVVLVAAGMVWYVLPARASKFQRAHASR